MTEHPMWFLVETAYWRALDANKVCQLASSYLEIFVKRTVIVSVEVFKAGVR